jgi:hypothetical protein
MWPQHAPSPGPSLPMQAWWQDLPTARLGNSGNGAEPLALQAPMPLSSAVAAVSMGDVASALVTASGPPTLSAQAGVGSSVKLNDEEMRLLLQALQ